MVRPLLALLAALVAPQVAAADVATKSLTVRQVGASARILGCSRYIAYCEGVSTSRVGLTFVDVGLKVNPRLQLVGMFHAAGRPADDLIASQVLLGAGPRLVLGNSWIQVGAGIAGARVGPNPKTITTVQLLRDVAPAVLAGIGHAFGDGDYPITLSLDASASVESDPMARPSATAPTPVLDDAEVGVSQPRIYQVSATVSRQF